jgi:hypothetical protein
MATITNSEAWHCQAVRQLTQILLTHGVMMQQFEPEINT